MRRSVWQLSLATLLFACSGGKQSFDVSGTPSAATPSHADQAISLTVPAPWSNSKTIPVSWSAIENASEYQLDLAKDEGCKNVDQSLRTKNTSTQITDLPEGTWYLCLRWKIEPKVHESLGSALKLVIDRQPPRIEGDSIQTLVLGGIPKVTVTDEGSYTCSWSSDQEDLIIFNAETMEPRFSASKAGIYRVLLNCVDAAANQSQQSFSLSLTAEP